MKYDGMHCIDGHNKNMFGLLKNNRILNTEESVRQQLDIIALDP
jgi:hypothetical protein